MNNLTIIEKAIVDIAVHSDTGVNDVLSCLTGNILSEPEAQEIEHSIRDKTYLI